MNMKKIYVKPAMTIMELETISMLCVSGTQSDSYDGSSSITGPDYGGEGDGEDY